MGSIEKYGVMQSAHGTPLLIGAKDPCPEDRLVKSGASETLNVRPLRSSQVERSTNRWPSSTATTNWWWAAFLFNEPDWVSREVYPSVDPDEVGKRQRLNHRLSQRPVIGMVGVSPPILVADQLIVAKVIGIGRRLIGGRVGGADRECGAQPCRFPDSSLNDKANRTNVEAKSVDIRRPKRAIRARREEAIQVIEHCHPELCIRLADPCHGPKL